MKAISVAVLAAVVAAGLVASCAATSQTTTAASYQQIGYAGAGPRAEEDPTYSLGNPFRLLAFVLYPAGLFLQRTVEIPYAVATEIDPSLFGITDFEQQYLQQRWGVQPGHLSTDPGPVPPAAN